jgi:hypothetical protein
MAEMNRPTTTAATILTTTTATTTTTTTTSTVNAKVSVYTMRTLRLKTRKIKDQLQDPSASNHTSLSLNDF